MDIAQLFGAAQNVLGLLSGDAAGLAHTNETLGIVAQIHAPFPFQIGGAFPDHPAKLPAFALGDADALPGFIKPIGHLFVFHFAHVAFDGPLHGNRTH